MNRALDKLTVRHPFVPFATLFERPAKKRRLPWTPISSSSRSTPRRCSAARVRVKATRWLLSLGADPTVHDGSFDATPLGWAEDNNQKEVARYLADLPH